MPTSCADLEQMGQRINGFFMVKGSKRMETVYCNFNANQNGTTCSRFLVIVCLILLFTDKQKWIGYADVKSAPVHFYVQRNSSFNTTETPIPFVLARVNEGNAMNLTSGIFTAPRPGTYFFSFTGTSFISSSSFYQFFSILYLNGNLIGRSYVYEDRGVNRKHSLLTFQSTLNLKKGDQVWVQIKFNGSSSHLFDSVNHYTHFTGFMLEEEIVASL